MLTVKGVYTNPAAGTSEYGLTLRTEVYNASHTPTPLHYSVLILTVILSVSPFLTNTGQSQQFVLRRLAFLRISYSPYLTNTGQS